MAKLLFHVSPILPVPFPSAACMGGANVTGSIPRADGGVTCIIQCYANGRICYEYRRLPDHLATEYRQMTFDDPTKGWREVWIETLPLERTMNAVRTIATKASMIELPVVP